MSECRAVPIPYIDKHISNNSESPHSHRLARSCSRSCSRTRSRSRSCSRSHSCSRSRSRSHSSRSRLHIWCLLLKSLQFLFTRLICNTDPKAGAQQYGPHSSAQKQQRYNGPNDKTAAALHDSIGQTSIKFASRLILKIRVVIHRHDSQK